MQVWAAICIVIKLCSGFESLHLSITLLVLRLRTDVQFSCMKGSWHAAVLPTASFKLHTASCLQHCLCFLMETCKALFVLLRTC